MPQNVMCSPVVCSVGMLRLIHSKYCLLQAHQVPFRCNFAKCFTNEHVHRVTRRINHLTDTPFDNGEDLQVVRCGCG